MDRASVQDCSHGRKGGNSCREAACRGSRENPDLDVPDYHGVSRKDYFDAMCQEVSIRSLSILLHVLHVPPTRTTSSMATLANELPCPATHVGLLRDNDLDSAAAFEDRHGPTGFCCHNSLLGLGTLEGQRFLRASC